MATRSVSLVDRLELEFQGTIYKNALAFGDVDGDGGNEVLICNTGGQLYIFKGKSTKPWKTCPGLGCVTVIIVGDIKNDSRNHVLCLNTEGCCFIFDPIKNENYEHESNPEDNKAETRQKTVPSKSPKSSPAHVYAELIKPICKLELPANPKMAILADINGDGLNELAVCYTDRNVRVFKWIDSTELITQREQDSHAPTSAKKQEHKLVKQPSKDEQGKLSTSVLVKQPSKDSGTSGNSPRSPKTDTPIRKDSKSKPVFDFEFLSDGKFEMTAEFSLPGQVGSVAVVRLPDGTRQLIASQPAGGYAILATYAHDSEDVKNSNQSNELEDSCSKNPPQNQEQPCVYYPASHYRLRNFKVESEVLGYIKRQGEISGLFCVCTVDGSYFVINNTEYGVNILPISTTTERKWFAMDQLDINADGNDAVILCSLDGMTCVIDNDFNIISYSFGDQICGFRAGMFAIDPHVNVPCFGYVTFLNRLVLYYDVRSIGVKSINLHETVIQKLKSKPEYGALLKSLENENGVIESGRLRKLIRTALA